MRTLWLTLLALSALLGGGALAAAAKHEGEHSSGVRLARLGSCAELLAYGQRHALPLVGPYGLWSGGRRPPGPRATQFQKTPAGREFSTTNVQEEGVDEPDIVKTDGAHLFAVIRNELHVLAVEPKLRRVAELALPTYREHELLLRKDRLLVLSYGGTSPTWLPGGVRNPSRYASETVLTELDVGRPARPTVVRTLTLTGAYIAARMLKGVVRVVTISSVPSAIEFVSPTGWGEAAQAAATARNRELLVAASTEDWLPRATLTDARRGLVEHRPLVQCRHVWRPAEFSGFGLTAVTTLDLDRGLALLDADAIFSDAEIVYASHDSLFVATERWRDRPAPGAPVRAPEGVRTTLHKFGIGGPITRYRASGAVSGYLMSQWSLSEHEGVMRVASSERPTWWAWREGDEKGSFVTALVEQAGKLVPVGRVGGLGRGQRVYAVRFVGEMGYVVTFREEDPLYAIDLSRPARPVVRGELHVPGYSGYLHPVGPSLLLGVGQEPPYGMLISLFDVSDAAKPKRMRHRILPSAAASVETDHRAFLYWPPRRLVVLPGYYSGDGRHPMSLAFGYRIGRGGIDPVGRIVHGDAEQLLRSVVIGDSLFTISTAGVKENGLRSFGVRGWAAFDEE